MRTDLVQIIDTAYRIDLDDESWLRDVAGEMRDAFPNALGVAVWTFRENDTASRVACAALGLSPTHVEALTALTRVLPEPVSGGGPSRGLWSVANARPPSKRSPAWSALDDLGVRDVLVATHTDESGDGMAIVWCKKRRSRVSRPLAARWGWVVKQLVRARAMRRVLTASPGPARAAEVERVVPADRTAASTPEADRTARRLAALSGEESAQLRGLDADGAHEAWRGLLDGRFAIVDRFEAGARRYLLARAVGPSSSRAVKIGEVDGRILHLRAMGHPLKVIASELGLSVSGVSRRLARAMEALALRTPCELAALFASRALSAGA